MSSHEYIFVANEDIFFSTQPGFVPMDSIAVVKLLESSIMAGRLEEMKTDKRFIPLATYCVVAKPEEGKIFAFERVEKVASIGFSDHIGLIDAMPNAKGEVFPHLLIMNAAGRILDESISQASEETDDLEIIGLINDIRDDCPAIGIVVAAKVSEYCVDLDPKHGARSLGFLTREDLLSDKRPFLDTWSFLLLDDEE